MSRRLGALLRGLPLRGSDAGRCNDFRIFAVQRQRSLTRLACRIELRFIALGPRTREGRCCNTLTIQSIRAASSGKMVEPGRVELPSRIPSRPESVPTTVFPSFHSDSRASRWQVGITYTTNSGPSLSFVLLRRYRNSEGSRIVCGSALILCRGFAVAAVD